MTFTLAGLLVLSIFTPFSRADDFGSATLMRRLNGAMLKADVILSKGEYHRPADDELVAARDGLDGGLDAVERAIEDCGETLFPTKVLARSADERRIYGRAYREHMRIFRATLIEYRDLFGALEAQPDSARRTEDLRRHRALIREVINAAHRELKAR